MTLSVSERRTIRNDKRGSYHDEATVTDFSRQQFRWVVGAALSMFVMVYIVAGNSRYLDNSRSEMKTTPSVVEKEHHLYHSGSKRKPLSTGGFVQHKKPTTAQSHKYHVPALDKIDPSGWARLDNQTCVQNGTKKPIEDWQSRLPRILILGAMKAGTDALWSSLGRHPQVVVNWSKKELHFFDKEFEEFATPQGILQELAQKAYGDLHRKVLPSVVFQKSSTVVAIDKSPRYLFWSDRIPYRVMCVAPWVKMLVLLRNPVERAYSHYVYTLTENFATKPTKMLQETFEEWIGHDMLQLESSGLLSANTAAEEMECWKHYLREMEDQTYAILGKGLYVIQLKHWFAALESVGKSPQRHMMILESNEFKHSTQMLFDRVTSFLDLPSFELQGSSTRHKSGHFRPINTTTQDRLEAFFKPYNLRLYELLGWDSVWEIDG